MDASKQPIIPVTPEAPAAKTEITAPVVTTITDPKADNERWAQLARKEKSLRALERDLKAKEATFKATPVAPDWKERIKTDALSMFAEAGLSQEDLVNLALNSKPEDMQIRAMRQELAALKAGQTEIKSASEQAQKQAYDDAVKQISRQVNMLVDGNESFETIKSMGRQDAVVELIEQTYKEEGTLLTVEEAASQIEDHLVEQALTLVKLKKIQSKLTPAPESTPEEKQEIPTSQRRQVSSPAQVIPRSPTLTHAITGLASTRPSVREKRERAIAAFKGQLK